LSSKQLRKDKGKTQKTLDEKKETTDGLPIKQKKKKGKKSNSAKTEGDP